MLVPFAWLRTLVNTQKTNQEICDFFNEKVIEAKIIGKTTATGVVVAEIVSAEKHPNADKLRVCRVFDGKDELQIVCGAPNARPGIRVALSKIGAILPGNFLIKKSKIRDVESFGMLCSASELGLSKEGEGILELDDSYEVGRDFSYYAEKNEVLEIDITPNRGDCASIIGSARELLLDDASTPTQEFLKLTNRDLFENIPVLTDISLSVDEAHSPKYTATKISKINNQLSSPDFIKVRLISCGQSPRNLLVDIANYVMLELGQPLHTFDFKKIKPSLAIRTSNGEAFTSLKNQDYELDKDTLVIASGDRVLCLAGAIGSSSSAVDDDTTEILLESAHFLKSSIKVKKYGISTDASYRFERGVDPEMVEVAVCRFIEILRLVQPNICVDGKAVYESKKYLPQTQTLTLTTKKIKQLLGIEVSTDMMVSYLKKLFDVSVISEECVKVLVKTNRLDITTETDLVEEFARLYGYNNILANPMVSPMRFQNRNDNAFRNNLSTLMISNGFSQVINYSFISKIYLENKAFSGAFTECVEVVNPITSTMDVLRPSIIPSLLNTASQNIKYSHLDLKLFEIGKSYHLLDGQPVEKWKLALVVFYPKSKKSWHSSEYPLDIYQLKAIAKMVDKNVSFTSTHNSLYSKAISINAKGQPIGVIGEVQTRHLDSLLDNKLKLSCLVLEMEIFDEVPKIPSFKAYSELPVVHRDFSFVVPEGATYSQIEKIIRKNAGKLLQDIELFDLYIREGIKSIAIKVIWKSETSTLTDDEIGKISADITSELKKNGIEIKN